MDTFCPQLQGIEERSADEQALVDRCNELFQASEDGRDAEVSNALRAIAPEEVAAQSDMGNTLANQQRQNLSSRLDTLRGGVTGGISLAGLLLRINGETLPLSVFNNLFANERGAAAGDNDGNTSSGLLSQRLGIFVTGTLGVGDRDTTSNERGFEYDTLGITAGADYRITDQLFAGAAFGLATTDLDYDNNSGDLEADGYSLSVYGLYHHTEALHFNGLLSLGKNDYDTTRNIDYNIGDDSIRHTARGNTDATTFSFSVGGGYKFAREDGLTTELVARYDCVSNDINGYTENGAAELNMRVNDHEVDTTYLVIGGRLLKAISQQWGIVIPQAEFN